MNTPEEIEAEIWRHALDLAEPGGLGRLIETEAVIQALILAAEQRGAARRAHWHAPPRCSAATSSRPSGA